MNTKYLLPFVLFSSLTITSCLPSKQITVQQKMAALPKSEKVIVIKKEDNLPNNATFIGTVKLGDSGFSTKCNWQTVIEIAQAEARKMGGNYLQIVEHITPSPFGSSCHRIKADVYNVDAENVNWNNNNDISRSTTTTIEKKKYQFKDKLQLGAYGGYSYMTGRIPKEFPNDVRDYLKKLKSGYHIGLSADYYVSPTIALGLYYTYFNTTNRTGITEYDTNTGAFIRNGILSDNVQIHFIAPTFTQRFIYNKNFDFNARLGIGYLSYRNRAVEFEPYTLKGKTVGVMFGLDGAYKITKTISGNLRLNLIAGSLKQFDYRNANINTTIQLPEGTSEDLSRLDISIGLKFLLF